MRSRQPRTARVRESWGDRAEHLPCLLPPASKSSPARLGSWGDTGRLGHSGLVGPSVLSTERSGSLETVGAGAQAGKRGAEPACSHSNSRGSDIHGQGPLPLLQPRRSVWVQGKSAPPGAGLKLSRAKPCPGRSRGFYGEPDVMGNPVPVPGSARPQGQVVVGWTQAPLSFLPGGTLHASSELCNPTRSVPEKTDHCSIYIEHSLSF